MDEFRKRQQLMDPGYVAPQSERVQNRQPIAFKAEPQRTNEAGLPFVEDSPVNKAMQELYIKRMMGAQSGGPISDAEADAMFNNDIETHLDAGDIKAAKRVYDLQSGEDLTDQSQMNPLELLKQRRTPQSEVGELLIQKPEKIEVSNEPAPNVAQPDAVSTLEAALKSFKQRK